MRTFGISASVEGCPSEVGDRNNYPWERDALQTFFGDLAFGLTNQANTSVRIWSDAWVSNETSSIGLHFSFWSASDAMDGSSHGADNATEVVAE
jgi:hypothetical protein